MPSIPIFGAYNPGSLLVKQPRSFSINPVPNPAHNNVLKAHAGDDWSTNRQTGVGIRAASDGVVVINDYNLGGWGNYLVIEHTRADDTKFRTLSGYMAKASSYKVGDVVKAGAVIGEAGQTGGATGIHLHFEVIDGGGTSIPSGVNDRFDPARFTNWGGLPAHIGTDIAGNSITLQTREVNGVISETIRAVDSSGEVVGTFPVLKGSASHLISQNHATSPTH